MTSNSGIIGFFIFWGSILTKLFYQPVLKMWDERWKILEIQFDSSLIFLSLDLNIWSILAICCPHHMVSDPFAYCSILPLRVHFYVLRNMFQFLELQENTGTTTLTSLMITDALRPKSKAAAFPKLKKISGGERPVIDRWSFPPWRDDPDHIIRSASPLLAD